MIRSTRSSERFRCAPSEIRENRCILPKNGRNSSLNGSEPLYAACNRTKHQFLYRGRQKTREMKPSDLSMGRVENNWIFKSKKKSGLNHLEYGFSTLEFGIWFFHIGIWKSPGIWFFHIGIWKCCMEFYFSCFRAVGRLMGRMGLHRDCSHLLQSYA